ncbi:TonB-dependent siderophore receptor [Olivibacter ginsenosidimutans]|uniref:TonB-dependent siderophore receptor n=2 Tax=Olivibacter ginsenosidimutans TaxID=1176537 RepID=A0ABP9AC47_9SPHI
MCVAAYAQNGSIGGTVKTSDQYYATDLTVSLNDSLHAKVSNNGTYLFKNLAPGKYIITTTHVGLQSESDTLFLKAGEALQFDFNLAVDNHTLQEVVVEGFKPIVEPNVSSSLRVETPVLELPQNVQIVNAEVLAKQQVFNLADGLIRNVSGVSRLAHWNDLYVNIHMRGSQIQAFRNGMNIVSSFWSPLSEDMAVVDRVEFVKGPAGFMMSSGDPAGIYNVVTKKPTGIEKGEVTFALGSFSSYRSTLDLDGILSKDRKLLYRLNIAADTKGSFRPFEDNKRLVLAPVLSYQLDDKTKATFEYTYQKAKMSDIGSSYVMSPFGYKTLPRDMTFSSEGLEPLDVNEHSTFLTVEHQFSKNWKLTAQGAYFYYDQIGASSWPQDVYANGQVIRKSDIWDAQSTMTMGQLFINGNVSTGTVQHKILAGLDMGDKKYYADWNTSFVLDSVGGGEFDPLDPNRDYTFDFPYQPFDRSIPIKTRAAEGGGTIASHYTSVYLQDELGFFENALRLTLAARFTNMSQASWGSSPIESKKVTPRVGLSYSIDKRTSVYGLYDQSFLPQNGFLFNGAEVKPITGDITEFGLKRDWFGGRLNTSISAYQILKNNEITSYGPKPDMSVEIGQKKVKGIEFDLRGQILPGFNAIANYAYTDGKITKINEGVEDFYVGQRLDGADKHIANLWLDYTLLKGSLQGLSLRAGVTTYIDRATQFYSNEHPEWNIEDYWRFDAGLGYHHDRFTATLNVQNLLDRYLLLGGSYYTDYFASSEVYSWQADLPRNFRLSFSYRF